VVDTKSDYKKKNFNLNENLPLQNRGNFLDSLNHNLFNRFLTSDEFDHIVGLIGDADPNERVSTQIKERTNFRQDNQLQPVVTKKIGTVNHFMTFEDFMTRIGRTGVDTEKFNEWGNLMQFNWMPPIDIDKIINYRDYYWENSGTNSSYPQYIVIKNQKNWTEARATQGIRSIVEISDGTAVSAVNPVAKTVSVPGNVADRYPVGFHFILGMNDGVNFLFTVHSATYNIATTNTDIVVEEYFTTSQTGENSYVYNVDIPVVTLNDNVVTVIGDYSKLLVKDYVLSINLKATPTSTVLQTATSLPEDAVFDAVTNTTTITLTPFTGTFSHLSMIPLLSSMNAEKAYAADNNVSIEPSYWVDSDIGEVLWYKNISILNSAGGATQLGGNAVIDNTVNFVQRGVVVGDSLEITKGQKGSGKYTISEVTPTTLSLEGAEFFTAENLSYKILRKTSSVDISSPTAPASPKDFDLWINTVSDTLFQWRSGAWIACLKGFSLLRRDVQDRVEVDYSNVNDWSTDNRWLHKSQITEFSGLMRAQLPIIEYFPFLEMATMSYSEKVWRYRVGNDGTYVKSTVHPRMIELMNFTLTADEFIFIDGYTIQFDEKFGNFGSQLKAGDKIRLKGFAQNEGLYVVNSSTYAPPAAGGRFVTTLVLDTPLMNVFDRPFGSVIEPELTSNGDVFLGVPAKQWEYGGVADLRASSLEPEKNPMLGINVRNEVVGPFETIIGLTSQTYSIGNGTAQNEPIFIFDESLQNIVLSDDYQEGDIRVYINGVRSYGTFEDIPSDINPDFVAGIKMINNYQMVPSDTIRIELGVYSLDEIGLGAVTVNTASGEELVNLVDSRKIEQRKSDTNQYPYFTLRDIYGNRLNLASPIFKYKEGDEFPVNINTMTRIATTDNIDYTFVQGLSDPETGRLYCYYDYAEVKDELQTIWKRGENNEQYVPTKVDGSWEMPNQWYYNPDHKNYTEMKLTEIFRHFNSIIDLQTQPGMYSKTGGLYFLDDEINYGIGGTIKEHNESFDTLMSAIFVTNGSPVSIIEFAKKQYIAQMRYVSEQFTQNATKLFNAGGVTNVAGLQTSVTNGVIDSIENNGKYDQWFGDSTSYIQEGIGVRNWIATASQFGLITPVEPILVKDKTLGIYTVTTHDGGQVNVKFDAAVIEQLARRITKKGTVLTQIVPNDSTPFPTTGKEGKNVVNGDWLLRTVTSTNTRNLYRATDLEKWELVDINAIYANTVLEIETRLYKSAVDAGIKNRYDFAKIEQNPDFNSLMEQQFLDYAKDNNIDFPLSNVDRYTTSNPFTWNYFYSHITLTPTGQTSATSEGTWQALYEKFLGTAYPHLEPWILQGYDVKPTWWEEEYAATDRRWQIRMWDNIIAGTIPFGRTPPSNPPKTYIYLPVNSSDSVTDDGYGLDALLPPYWNTINTTEPRVRGFFDPNLEQFPVTPNADFEFGQNGLVEWEWKRSIAYPYDKMVAAYKIDPMRFMHQTIGIDYQLVSCLQISKESEKVYSHRDIIFHGDFIPDTNQTYKSFGLNQWYVHYTRYHGFDGISSEFRDLWKNWTPDLSYLFGAFIDTPSFRINSDFFDITTKDYEILVKKTKGIADKWLQSLNASAISVPNEFSRLRDKGIGWTVEFSNITPVNRPMEYYGVQNYSFTKKDDTTMRLYSYDMQSAGVNLGKPYQIVEFSQPLAMNSATGLNSGEVYPFVLNLSGTDVVGIIEDADTVESLLFQIRGIVGTSADIELKDGNIIVYGTSTDTSIEVGVTPFNTMTNYVGHQAPSATQNKFEKFFIVSGNVETMFVGHPQLVVTDSDNFNGTYTINKIVYDERLMTTRIYVLEDVTLPVSGPVVANGRIEPVNATTLPASWTTGTMVYLNTTGYLPSALDDELPYYIVRVNDREFKLAETREAAILGNSITVEGTFLGESYVGIIDTTFTTGVGKDQYVWRNHAVDTRKVLKASLFSISGIQQMVDFLNGYSRLCEDNGFKTSGDTSLNQSIVPGANTSWFTEIETFVRWLYTIRNNSLSSVQSFEVYTNTNDNTFVMASGASPNWVTGTPITLRPNASGELPDEFNTPYASQMTYYVIRLEGRNDAIQVAPSHYDAMRGFGIDLGGSNFGPFFVQTVRSVVKYPMYEINPYKFYVWFDHPLGVLSDVLDDTYTDPYSAARLYDDKLLEMNVSDILVYRHDKISRISMTENKVENALADYALGKAGRHMSGMHLYLDGYEHILRLQDRSVEGSLIYDSFFGLNTPRLYVEFDRQQEFNLRPNVGGFVMKGDSLVQNLESVTNDMRHFYDAVIAPEGRMTTNLVRKSLGYDGPKKYMDDLKINAKTQFQFWLGLIQNKGTNKAVDAFVNQTRFESAEVDEFWAYKIAEYGDNNVNNHLEMRLFPADTVKNELRVDFVAPENVAPDRTFQSVQLTDMARWWKQPDQIEEMSPYQAYFFNSKVVEIVEEVNVKSFDLDGKLVYVHDKPMNGVVMTYLDPVTYKIKTLVENIEYKFLNAYVLEFMVNVKILPAVTLSIMDYDYNAHTPSKVIDKGNGVVSAILPIWNPASGQYLTRAMAVVDIKRPDDAAIYTHSLDGSNTGTSVWKSDYNDLVWLDDSLESYVPYSDRTIFPNISDRISRWGNMNPWSKLSMYQWTESKLSPIEYEEEVRRQNFNNKIPNELRLSGTPYKRLYENVRYGNPDDGNMTPLWVEVKEGHLDFFAGLVDEREAVELGGHTASVYINGVFIENILFETRDAVLAYFKKLKFGDYCHTIKRIPVPSAEEVRLGKYQFYTPYSLEKRFDSVGGKVYNVYHYWVTEKKNYIRQANQTTTLYTAQKELNDMSDPYMIIEGFKTPDFGYGLLFGNIYDEFGYELPYRFTQMVVKGLQGMVKDNTQFVLRLTREFTLRDSLERTAVVPKNRHAEWKLFRERQLEKIDRYLWNKATEALIGFKLKSDNVTVDSSKPIPSLNRILYDRLYKSDTQYGMGPEQVFTNATLSLGTVLSVLTDPNNVFEYINIVEFLDKHDFVTPEGISQAMYEIYQNFSIDEVNKIFFAILYDAMSLKKEHSEIFKTSWVALQISQSVTENTNVPYDVLRLVEGPGCEVEVPVEPSPTPTPTPSTTPQTTVTPTPTPTLTPSPTPSPRGCGRGDRDRITEEGDGRTTEDDDCRVIEPEDIPAPTPQVTYSMTPTPSITPTK
jgi:hypothetical protein